MPANLENSAVTTGLEKVSFHSNPKERQYQRMFKLTLTLISHASKVMLKILQARLQQYVNFQMFRLDWEKPEEPEIKFLTSTGSSKNQESSRKTSMSALFPTPKPLTVWITSNCGKLSILWSVWEPWCTFFLFSSVKGRKSNPYPYVSLPKWSRLQELNLICTL